MTNSELQPLRNEIDRIDAQIVQLLAERFLVTAEVGKVKARNALAPVDTTREAAQFLRYRELAAQNGLNPELVISVFRSVIDEVVRNHGVA